MLGHILEGLPAAALPSGCSPSAVSPAALDAPQASGGEQETQAVPALSVHPGDEHMRLGESVFLPDPSSGPKSWSLPKRQQMSDNSRAAQRASQVRLPGASQFRRGGREAEGLSGVCSTTGLGRLGLQVPFAGFTTWPVLTLWPP